MMFGNIEIQLPQEAQVTLCISKVAHMENGVFVLGQMYLKSEVDLNVLETAKEMEYAAERLMKYSNSGFLIETDEAGFAQLEDLEEGVYLIRSFENEEGETILPTLLFLPTWDEVEQKMLYDVTIIPKFGEKIMVPETGDGTNSITWLGTFFLSIVVLVYQMKKFTKKRIVF